MKEIKFLPKICHIMVVANQCNIISILSVMFKKCLIIVISIKKTNFQNHNGSECSGTGWHEQACPVINIVSIAACSSKNFFNSPYWAIVPHNYSAHSINLCPFQPKITCFHSNSYNFQIFQNLYVQYSSKAILVSLLFLPPFVVTPFKFKGKPKT